MKGEKEVQGACKKRKEKGPQIVPGLVQQGWIGKVQIPQGIEIKTRKRNTTSAF